MANIHLPYPTTSVPVTKSVSGTTFSINNGGTGGGVYGPAGTGGYKSYEPPSEITFTAGDAQEILRVAKDGFYVRGVKVPADDKEAETVYNAFKRWMVEQQLRKPY